MEQDNTETGKWTPKPRSARVDRQERRSKPNEEVEENERDDQSLSTGRFDKTLDRKPFEKRPYNERRTEGYQTNARSQEGFNRRTDSEYERPRNYIRNREDNDGRRPSFNNRMRDDAPWRGNRDREDRTDRFRQE